MNLTQFNKIAFQTQLKQSGYLLEQGCVWGFQVFNNFVIIIIIII